jgi:hypothetical protein
MANEEHLAILRQGVEAWNAWRREHLDVSPDLRGADLNRANLSRALLYETDLRGAFLSRVNLTHADLRAADLRTTDLRESGFFRADLVRADLSGADIGEADLRWSVLNGADLSGAILYQTLLADVDLSNCRGLETCQHFDFSTIDHRTLQRSGPLPLAFLRGVGLPDTLIDNLSSLLTQAIQRYSCFISYSSRDEDFAQRLHADLQNKGVRCWFAPHDMPIGAKILDAIDEAIRLRDKLLLILSKRSIASDWVEDEVTTAFAEERRRGQLVLFPVRIDDAVLTTAEPWAGKLRDNRNIGDFRRWKDHDSYQKALDRLLLDLRVERA